MPGVSWNPQTMVPQGSAVTEMSLDAPVDEPTAVPDLSSAPDDNTAADVTHNAPSIRTITVAGEERTYSIIENFASCPVIDNILDHDYRDGFSSELADLGWSDTPNLVLQLEKSGVLNGRDKARFEPQSNISRAEFLKIILRAHCYEYRREDTERPVFADLVPWSWESQVAQLGHKLGIIDGDLLDDGAKKIFRPQDPISRAEAIKMLMNIAFLRTDRLPETSFYDVPASEWFKTYVSRAEYLDIVNPEATAYFYKPDAPMTRDGMVLWLTKTLRLYR